MGELCRNKSSYMYDRSTAAEKISNNNIVWGGYIRIRALRSGTFSTAQKFLLHLVSVDYRSLNYGENISNQQENSVELRLGMSQQCSIFWELMRQMGPIIIISLL